MATRRLTYKKFILTKKIGATEPMDKDYFVPCTFLEFFVRLEEISAVLSKYWNLLVGLRKEQQV